MSYLDSLESSASRRRSTCCRQRTINTIVISLVLFGLFVTTLIFIIRSLQPPPFIPSVPHDQTITEGTKHFDTFHQWIQTNIKSSESPLDKAKFDKFQQDQQALAEYHHKRHGGGEGISRLLSSVYTPTPIFVPNADHLIALHGSCHPINPFQHSIHHDETHNNQNSDKKDNGDANAQPQPPSTSPASQTSDSICYPCTPELVAAIKNTSTNSPALSPDLCTSAPQLAIYECDSPDGTSNPTKNGNSKPIKVIPCSAVFVDGTSQFWAMYAIATILIIVTSVAVRRRFDKAQEKVMARISKTLR